MGSDVFSASLISAFAVAARRGVADYRSRVLHALRIPRSADILFRDFGFVFDAFGGDMAALLIKCFYKIYMRNFPSIIYIFVYFMRELAFILLFPASLNIYLTWDGEGHEISMFSSRWIYRDDGRLRAPTCFILMIFMLPLEMMATRPPRFCFAREWHEPLPSLSRPALYAAPPADGRLDDAYFSHYIITFHYWFVLPAHLHHLSYSALMGFMRLPRWLCFDGFMLVV